MSLRQGERRLRGEREAAGDLAAVKIIDKLDRAREALRRRWEEGEVDWQEEYERICQAFETLLKRCDQAELSLRAAIAKRDAAREYATVCIAHREERLQEELIRVKEELDDAREQAKHAFAMGRRSASARSAAA